MTITITLPERLEQALEQAASRHQLSIEELTIQLLDEALTPASYVPSLDEIVARLKGSASNPALLRPAQGSLADALREAPTDPDFDLAAWQREWAEVETEVKAVTRANDLEEGRL